MQTIIEAEFTCFTLNFYAGPTAAAVLGGTSSHRKECHGRFVSQSDGLGLSLLRDDRRHGAGADLGRHSLGCLHALRSKQRGVMARTNSSSAHDLADLFRRGCLLPAALSHECFVLRDVDAGVLAAFL